MHEMFTSYAKMITPDVSNIQSSLQLDSIPAIALIQAESH